MVSQREVDRRVASLSAALRRHGLRLTHQRLEVVREIAGSDEHPDVETIYRGLRSRVPTISLDTVYRTLATLADLRLIAQVTVTAGPARYDGNPDRHHHFICTRCGLVRDIVDVGLDAVRAPDQTAALGTVEAVEVRLRGVCRTCEESQATGRVRDRRRKRTVPPTSQPTREAKDTKGELS